MPCLARLSCVILCLGFTQPARPVLAQRLTPSIDLYSDMLMTDARVHGPSSSASRFAVDGRVSVLLATQIGRTVDVAARIRARGGAIEFEDETVGYLRARVPTAEAIEVRRWPEIVASQIDGRILPVWIEVPANVPPKPSRPRPVAARDPVRQAGQVGGVEKPVLDAVTARRAPYNLDSVIGVSKFRQHCPTCDGRGVTIAIVEGTHLPLEHVAFSLALDLEGRPIKKLVGFIDSELGGHRVNANRRVTSSEPRVWIDGQSYELPSAGQFEMGAFRFNDVMYAVLWAVDGPGIWLDTNRNRDFRDETELRDARMDPKVGRFTTPPPWRGGEFFATRDEDGHAVRIHRADSAHVAMTASVAAGADVPGNLAVGVAPAARLVLVDVGETAHDYLEALIAAARHPLVDVISASLLATRNTPGGDGQLAGIVIDRIVERYDKAVVAAAGNTGPIEQADPPGVLALSVGAYAHRASLKAMYGLTFARDEGVTSYSARGPTVDGRAKPDLVAPVERIAAAPCGGNGAQLTDSKLPPCYLVAGGTSSAAPEVAGALGLLISAARQRGLRAGARDVMDALRYTARYMTDTGAAAQGSGLLQVDAAWAYLQAERVRPRIVGSGPLAHAAVPYLASGARGPTIYEREGWRLGMSGLRSIELVGHGLATRAKRYELAWVGNDGTFVAPEAVVLKRDEAVRVPIRIHAKSVGITSALLRVKDTETRDVVHQQMVTIAVPQELEAANGWRIQWKERMPWTDRRDYAIRIPRGVDALRVSLQVSADAFVRLFEPGGFPYHRAWGDQFQQPFTAGEPWAEVLPDPVAGTWYVSVAPYIGRAGEGERRSSAEPFEFTVSLDAMFAGGAGTAMQTAASGDSAQSGRSCQTRENPGWQASRVERLDTADGTPLVTSVRVGRDVRSVRFGTLGTQAVHLYLYDCTSGTCLRFDTLTPAAPGQAIRIERPRAGEWRLAATRGPGEVAGDSVPLQIEWACGVGSEEHVDPMACRGAIGWVGGAAMAVPIVLRGLECPSPEEPSGTLQGPETRSGPAGEVIGRSEATQHARRVRTVERKWRPVRGVDRRGHDLFAKDDTPGVTNQHEFRCTVAHD